MKTISPFIRCALAALIVGFAGTAIANDDPPPTAEQLAAEAADQQYLADLAYIANNRSAMIANIVAVWGSSSGPELSDALGIANDDQLLRMQDASSFDDIRAILQGRETPAGVSGTEDLGSFSSDLVYTPVVPCRIFDTRFDSVPGVGHPGGNVATIRNYQVFGSAGLLAPQGHNNGIAAGPGCPLPPNPASVEPVGIHANFTAAPQASPSSGKGNIRAYPFAGALPSVSLVNYEAGTNIANTASIGSCYLCGPEISVAVQFHSADSIGDVMGYFFPAVQTRPVTASTTIDNIGTTCDNVETVTINVPVGGGTVTVVANVLTHLHKNLATATESMSYYLSNVNGTTCSTSGNITTTFYSPSNDGGSIHIGNVTLSQVYTAAAGTRTYYLNATGTDDSNTSTGDWIHADGAKMTATFHY